MTSPPGFKRGLILDVTSSFSRRSSYQNIMSSALNGAPSDHFMPLRSVKVRALPSGANT